MRNLIAVLMVFSCWPCIAVAQERKSDILLGANWQAVPSTATADGSVAWFFDPNQNRVLACYSSKSAPEPRCHEASLPEPRQRR
ncbi:MAG: hypothetical protein ACKVQA_12270 [Burkholderiales bacterium]